jgi:sugar O-acyltransferase (sialic acid O-acetyltransferase NeuD family)
MHIIGAGGHGKVVAEMCELNEHTISCFIDENREINEVLSIKVIHEFPQKFLRVVVAIGNNLIRKKIVLENDYFYPTLIHPKTCISKRTIIGDGTVIVGGATVNIDAKIGKHVIINTNASVGHDCIIEDFVHIAPNVALAGNVRVGEGTHVGLGAAVRQGVVIGKWCVIGAGTVVINNIPDGTMAVGNPARLLNIQVIDSVPRVIK